jgi:uncharacterized protein
MGPGSCPRVVSRRAELGSLCVLEIKVQAVFFQCGRALLRSSLWSTDHTARAAVPSAGQMLAALTNDAIDGKAYDQELPRRQAASLY